MKCHRCGGLTVIEYMPVSIQEDATRCVSCGNISSYTIGRNRKLGEGKVKIGKKTPTPGHRRK